MDRKLSESPIYEFGPFLFDPTRRVLTKNGEEVRLTSKVSETLTVFIENPGKVLEKDYLMDRVWPDTVVEESNLSQNVSVLRRTLGEKLDDHKYIVTIPGRGYSFVAEVRAILPDPISENNVDIFVEESSRITISEHKEEETEGETKAAEALPAGLLLRLSQRTRISQKGLVAIGIVILLIPAGAFAAYRMIASQGSQVDWRELHFKRLAGRKSKKSELLTRPRISPSGTLICYSAPGDRPEDKVNVWVMQIEFKNPTQLTWGGWSDTFPVWSPDSQQIAFISDRSGEMGIWAIPYLQGDPVLLKSLGPAGKMKAGPMLKHWGNGGTTIYYEVNHNLYALDVPSKEISAVTSFDTVSAQTGEFRVSQDEKSIVYVDHNNDQPDLWLIDRQSGKSERLTDDPEDKYIPIWCPDNKRIIYSATKDNLLQLFVMNVYERIPRQITTGEGHGYASDVSANGERILEYAGRTEIDLFSFSLASREETQITDDVGLEFWGAFSHDGSTVAYQKIANDREVWGPEHTDLIVRSLDTQSRSGQITLQKSYYARWSPVSNQLAFFRRGKTVDIWTINVPGGEAKKVATDVWNSGYIGGPIYQLQTTELSWSPDGLSIAYTAKRDKLWDIFSISLDGNTEVNWSANKDESVQLLNPIWSPAGNRIAYVSKPIKKSPDLPSTWELYVSDHGQPAIVFQHDSDLRLIGWASGTEELLVSTFASTPPVVGRYSLPQKIRILGISVGTGAAREIATLDSVYIPSLRMSPDGKSLAYVAVRNQLSNVWQLTLDGKTTQITDNKDAQIYHSGLNWSLDGHTLVYGKDTYDTWITMIDGFR